MNKVRLISIKDLSGVSVGLYIANDSRIYVSPSIYNLCTNDLESIRKHLVIIKMPQVNDKNKYGNLDEWIKELRKSNRKIFPSNG